MLRLLSKEASPSLEKLDEQELLEGLGAAQDLWFVTAAEGLSTHFIEISPAFAPLLDYSEEELISRPWVDFVHPPELDRLKMLSAQVRGPTHPLVKSTVKYRKADGRLVYLEIHSARRGAYIFSSCRDVTEDMLKKLIEKIAHASMKELAAKDSLTGLFNRRFFDELLERELRRANRTLRPLALISLDLDHFKELNDTYGHATGDSALRATADCLRENVRSEDMLFRVGGEELAILIPECQLETAVGIAKKIVQSIHDCIKVPGVRFTVSAGCVVFPDHGTDAQSLTKAADVALYAAKNSGRNRVRTMKKLNSSI